MKLSILFDVNLLSPNRDKDRKKIRLCWLEYFCGCKHLRTHLDTLHPFKILSHIFRYYFFSKLCITSCMCAAFIRCDQIFAQNGSCFCCWLFPIFIRSNIAFAYYIFSMLSIYSQNISKLLEFNDKLPLLRDYHTVVIIP